MNDSELEASRAFAFIAIQQALNAQSSRIGAIDANLGVLILAQVSALLYLLGQRDGPLGRVLTLALAVCIAFALVALVFLRSTESPHAERFARGLRVDVASTMEAAITAMATDFSHNELRVHWKNRILRVGFVALVVVAVTTAAAHL